MLEACQVNVALSERKNDELPLTCAFCNEYTEVLKPVLPGFWNRLAEVRSFKIANLENNLRHHMETEQARIDKEAKHMEEEYMRQKAVCRVKPKELLRPRASQLARDNFDTRKRDFVPTKVPPLSGAELGEMNRLRFNGQDPARLMELQEKHLVYVDAYSNVGGEQGILNAMIEDILDKDFREEIDKMASEGLIEVEERYHKGLRSLDENRKQLAAHREAAILEIKEAKAAMYFPEMESEFKHMGQGSASFQFFVCKRDCQGAFCMRCELPIEKKSIDEHVCAVNAVEDLYRRVITVLAEAAVIRCPVCGRPGIKDLACCHITCACTSRWCYHCGKSERELGSIGGAHNEWYLDVDGNGTCPMYLHYKYGDRENGRRMDGDPAQSLYNFHLARQKEAIMKLEQEIDSHIWAQMMNKYFPMGIWN